MYVLARKLRLQKTRRVKKTTINESFRISEKAEQNFEYVTVLPFNGLVCLQFPVGISASPVLYHNSLNLS